MRRPFLLIISIFTFLTSLVAQQTEFLVSGTVVDANDGVPYVNVSVLGSNDGTTTNEAGQFQLPVKTGATTLVFSAVGYSKIHVDIKVNSDKDLGTIIIERTIQSIETFVVTGTMKPISRSDSPVPVQVLNSEAFKANPTPSLLGAVAQVNGVRPQINCSVCATSDIHINGMEGPYTMVLIDGMPIVSGLGSVYGLSAIPTSMIERVEVIKGPGSSLYGSEAMGGVINVITKDAILAPKATAELSVTDWGELQLDAGFSRRGKKVGQLLGISTYLYDNPIDRNNDGFTDLAIQKRASLFYKARFIRPDKRKAGLAARLIHEDRWGGEMDWKPSNKGGSEIYGESIVTQRYEMIGEYHLPLKERVLAQVSLNGHFQDSFYGTGAYKADQNIGFAQLTWQHKYNRLVDVMIGSSVRYRSYNDNTTATELNGTDAPVSTLIPGLFVQNESEFSTRTTALLGYRFDEHPDHGSVHSPRLALRYKPNGKFSMRGSFATGFRVVDVFSEDHAALTGSREVLIRNGLEPERSVNGTMNFIRRFTSENRFLELDLTLFHSHFSNRIIADLDTDPDLIIYDNLDGTGRSQGVSFDQYMRFGEKWSVRNGVSFMRVDVTEQGSTEQVLFAPKWSGTANVSFTLDKRSQFDLNAQWYGPMRLPIFENDPRAEYSPAHALLNLQYRRKLDHGFELFGGMRNLMDFVPKDALLRSHDPFDELVNDPIDNPNGLNFDTTYMYASLQGRRGFLGLRYTLDK